MELPAAHSPCRHPGQTLAEHADALTAERRVLRRQDILARPELLLEAVIEYGDTDAFDASACAAFVRSDLRLLRQVCEDAAAKMAAHEIRALDGADVLAEDDAVRAERRRDERAGR